jgi:hypothetical protein
MRNVPDKSCTENQNTHFVSSNFFFENRAVCEIMWENIVDRGRPQYNACALHARYPRLKKRTLRICNIFGYPLQQLLQERASMLPYPNNVLPVYHEFLEPDGSY